jgi:membrane dipeptidase
VNDAWRDHLEPALALHAGLPLVVAYFDHCDEPFMAAGGRFADCAKLDAANIRHFVCSIGFGCYFATGPDSYALAGPDDWLLARQLERVDFVLNNIERCPRTYLVRRRGQMAADPMVNDAIGVILHLTGHNHTGDVATLERLFRRGVRAWHPAMQYHNRWVGGCEQATVNGEPPVVLTELGRELIARMNTLGIAVDTAHAVDASAQAMIAASAKPVFDSHTGSRTFVPANPRCLADETLRQIADGGGVVGIHFADHMLHPLATEQKYAHRADAAAAHAYSRHVLALTDDPDERVALRRGPQAAAARARFYAEHGFAESANPTASRRVIDLTHMAAHIEHLVNVCGRDHVGLGGDINGIADHQWPGGMDHVGELPHLTAELLRRGWCEADLEAFLAGNFRRFFRDVLPDE